MSLQSLKRKYAILQYRKQRELKKFKQLGREYQKVYGKFSRQSLRLDKIIEQAYELEALLSDAKKSNG